jgi:uncharacterized protein
MNDETPQPGAHGEPSRVERPALIVPGIGNSGPTHWQTVWEGRHPLWRRVVQRDWDYPECDEWVRALDAAVAASPVPPVIIAHSIGCLTVVHWASRSEFPIHAAFLVAVPDPDGPGFPDAAKGFAPLPLAVLRCPGLVVASTDDPFGSVLHAQRCAAAWGSACVSIGAAGHINADSRLGAWPEGFSLLTGLLAQAESRSR